jgi:hypothetical protein
MATWKAENVVVMATRCADGTCQGESNLRGPPHRRPMNSQLRGWTEGDYGGRKHLWNVGLYLPDYTAPDLWIQPSSQGLLPGAWYPRHVILGMLSWTWYPGCDILGVISWTCYPRAEAAVSSISPPASTPPRLHVAVIWQRDVFTFDLF